MGLNAFAFFRNAAFGALGSCCLLLAGAHWNSASVEAAPGDGRQGDQTKPAADIKAQAAPTNTLEAGGIRAVMGAAKSGSLYSAGSSVFTEVVLTNTTDDGKAQADLLLEVRDGEIVGFTGKNIASAEDGANRLVRVGDLAKGADRKVVVEMKLNEAPATGAKGESTLKVTLRKPTDPKYETKVVTTTRKKSYCRAYGKTRSWRGNRRRCVRWGKRTITKKKEIKTPVIVAGAAVEGPSDSVVLRWPVSNCSQAFYGALVKVREAKSEPMGDALKRSRSRDRSRRGGWLFTPSAKNAAERKINKLARTFVRARGIDPEMSSKRNYGWVSQKVASDLRGYLAQDPNPSICTGVLGFVRFFDGRLKDFWQRGERFSAAAKDAREIAVAKLAKAQEVLKADPGGHPGAGSAPMLTGRAEAAPSKPDVKALIGDAAKMTGDSDTIAAVGQAESDYKALSALASWSKKPKDSPLSKDSLGAIRRALGAIEVAEYLSTVAGQYQDLNNTIGGSMVDIRDAHGRHCRCDS